jgi:hypothetical protein
VKAISLWQPWASLWLSEHKVHETRHWPCRYHGWLLVHAAKKFPTLEPDDPLCDMLHRSYGADWRKTLPTGAIIGAVNLISTMGMEHTSPEHDDDRECGNWSPERFAWRRGTMPASPSRSPTRANRASLTSPPIGKASIRWARASKLHLG